MPSAPHAGDRVVVGVDVGGTRTKSTATTPEGDVLAELTAPTPAGVGPVLPGLVADLVSRHAEQLGAPSSWRPAAVGVAVPGLVDDAAGVGLWSANLGWTDLDVRGPVAERLGVPVAVTQDVRAGLVAERRSGAARGADDVLFVPIGTGIAAAACVDGHVVTRPAAGEIGHVVVEPGGDPCGCGGRGCLETVAGARAIATRFARRLGVVAPGASSERVAALVAGAPGTAEERGAARAVWADAVAALADVLAPAVAMLGSTLVLVGGGLARSGGTLLDPVRSAVADRLAGDAPVVAAASLGDRAGSRGAAVLAADLLRAGEPT